MKKRPRLVSGLIGLVIGLVLGAAVMFAVIPRPPKPLVKQGIFPTIFMTGSDGKIDTLHPMVEGLTKIKGAKLQEGLQVVYQADGSLKVTGAINKRNKYPAVEIGMVNGTNNSVKVEEAIYKTLAYLQNHYKVEYYNMLGFSAGGTGVFRYLINHSTDHSLPTVKKWVSLDGQYNASTAQPNQTLQDVLTNGPQLKTKYYLNEEATFYNFDNKVQVAMLAGKYKGQESDGVVPWADTFSIYHLLIKNGNPVSRYICTGPDEYTNHTGMPKNPEAIQFVQNFLFE